MSRHHLASLLSEHPQQDARPEPSHDARPEPSHDARPEPSQDGREPPHDGRPEPSHDTRPEPSQDAHPEPSQDARPEPSQDARPEPSQDAHPEPLQDTRPEPSQDARPEPSQDARPEPSQDGREPPLTSSAALQRSTTPRLMLSADISRHLAAVWSPQQFLPLLVCCDLLDEFVCAARQRGDRSALLVGVLRGEPTPGAIRRRWVALFVERLLSATATSQLVGSVRLLLPPGLPPGLLPSLLPSLLSSLPAGLPSGLAHLLRHLPCLVPARQLLRAVPLHLPAASGWQLAQQLLHQLLDSCRLQQLQPRSQLLSYGDRLLSGLADPSPLETRPPYLVFLQTVLNGAVPAELAMRETPTPARSTSKACVAATGAPVNFGLAAAPALATRDAAGIGQTVGESRSAGQQPSETGALSRRGLLRRVSLSDIWRPTGHEVSSGQAPSGGRRERSRSAEVHHEPPRCLGSAEAAVSWCPPRYPGRSWRTLPSRQTGPSLPAADSTQQRGGRGDGASLKQPALRLSRGVGVPRPGKHEHAENLMRWLLLWRHREARLDLVKPLRGPRLALPPTMPDVLVYIWRTDRMTGGQERGRSAPAPRGVPAPPMGAEMAKPGNAGDTSSSEDNDMLGENEDEDPMVRHRGEFINRGRDGGYRGGNSYRDQRSGYAGHDSQRHGSSNTAMRGYGNQGGPQKHGYQGGGNRYQAYGNSRQNPRGMDNRGYDSGAYPRYDRGQNMGNQDQRGFSYQDEGKRFGDPEVDRYNLQADVPDGPGERRSRSPYRPYDRGAAPGSGPPATGRRAGSSQVRFGGSAGAGRADKWGSWDDFRSAPVNMQPDRSPQTEWGAPRSVSAQPAGGRGRADGWRDNTRTLVPPPRGSPEPPAGWERQDRRGRSSAPPPSLALPAGTAPSWDKPLHAVRVGVAGAQWKQMHGLDKVEGDECFMVYDDQIVRMENFTADTGATIDVVEKVAVYSPGGSARVGARGSGRAAPVSRDSTTGRGRGRGGAPCVDCEWQPWSTSNLAATQRPAQSAPSSRSAAAPQTISLQVPVPASGGKAGCVDCGKWDHWSASTLKSTGPASERTESPLGAVSERPDSAGVVPSRSDMSMSHQSELSDRSDLISQLSDEVRQLRQEQRQLRSAISARSPSPAAGVNAPQLTRLINRINEALEDGLAQLQRGEVWRPQSIHAISALLPYVQAMRLPAPLLEAIVFDAESRHSSRAGSRSVSRPSSGRSGAASSVEPDATYRGISPELISQLVAEEVRKALRDAAPGSDSSGSRQSQRRPRSTSPAPARDIIVHESVRRSHSHDPNTASPPAETAGTAGSGAGSRAGSGAGSRAGSGRQSSRSSSPAPAESVGAAPTAAYRDFPFLLHLEDGGTAEQKAARQVRAVQESPTARTILQLLHDTDHTAPGGEPDLVERVLGAHKRGLGGTYDRKADNMRAIQLLHADLPEDEAKADHHTTQEIQQLDGEIANLKRALRALDSTEKLSAWRSPSDELRYLQYKSRQMEDSEWTTAASDGRQDDAAAAEEVVVVVDGRVEHQAVSVSEGTGSECKVKQPRRPDGRKHTQIVYDLDPKKSPGASAGAESGASTRVAARSASPKRRGRKKRLPGADGHMDVDLSEDEPPATQRARRRFVPAADNPGATRSTPDAARGQRPAAPLPSRSVFETTRGYQTGGESRYLRAADLEPVSSAPLAVSSTDDEIEIGSYSVSEVDRQRMARPITTRDALGLAEGHDAQQQMSRGLLARTGGQQTQRRAPSPPKSARPPAALVVREEGGLAGPPMPSSTVPSDPLLRTVPSWGRQADSAAGVSDAMLKSYPSYLPDQLRSPSAEELSIELGPIQVGISPNRIVGRLAELGNRLGQAVGLAEQQQDYGEAHQVLQSLGPAEQRGPAPQGSSSDSLEPFSSALTEPTQSMQQVLEQRIQPSSVDVMFSAEATPVSTDEHEDSGAETAGRPGAVRAEASPGTPGPGDQEA